MDKTYTEGLFCWAELGSTNPEESGKFYSKLFPWTVQESVFGHNQTYTVFQYDKQDIAAMYGLGETTIPSYWGCYIAVNNIEVSSKRAEELGAEMLIAPRRVDDKGSMCAFRDPTGATVALWEAGEHPGAGLIHAPYSMDWHELSTTDLSTAADFYTGLLGWTKEEVRTPTGPYLQFRAGDQYAAGMNQISPEAGSAGSYWSIYFKVPDCDSAVQKAQELGAEIIVPPYTVPGSGRFAAIRDPQGAFFSVQSGFQE
ncbi:VOC family protein [Paenibacillus tuaregi]|uniref:VOC family protein n=1 Tax=Paenibacillus tuaregi TaxID=1816681 RepID=UPI0008391AD1|nr:VOC family protein [Paenibacillus tuaregi]